MPNAKPSPRVIWIDEIRAILFIIICLSHLFESAVPYSAFSHILTDLTAYAVGGFFLISGYLTKVSGQDSLSFICRKFTSLLIPYLVLSLITAAISPYSIRPDILIEIGYPKWNLINCDMSLQLKAVIEWFAGDIACMILGMGSRQTQPLWFVFDLFIIQLAYYLLREKLHVASWLIFIISFSVATILDIFNLNPDYLRLGAKLMGLALLTAGVMLRSIPTPRTTTFIISSIIAITAYMLCDTTCHFVHNRFGGTRSIFFVTTIIASIYSCIFVLPAISHSRISSKVISNALCLISINSIYILGLHFYFMTAFNVIFYNNHQIGGGMLICMIIAFTLLGTIISIPLIKALTTIAQNQFIKRTSHLTIA